MPHIIFITASQSWITIKQHHPANIEWR